MEPPLAAVLHAEPVEPEASGPRSSASMRLPFSPSPAPRLEAVVVLPLSSFRFMTAISRMVPMALGDETILLPAAVPHRCEHLRMCGLAPLRCPWSHGQRA